MQKSFLVLSVLFTLAPRLRTKIHTEQRMHMIQYIKPLSKPKQKSFCLIWCFWKRPAQKLMLFSSMTQVKPWLFNNSMGRHAIWFIFFLRRLGRANYFQVCPTPCVSCLIHSGFQTWVCCQSTLPWEPHLHKTNQVVQPSRQLLKLQYQHGDKP